MLKAVVSIVPTLPPIQIDADIPCQRCPLLEPPKCSCWEELFTNEGPSTPQHQDVAPMWLQPSHWAPGLFSGADPRSVNKARVCAHSGRVIHIFSGEDCIDLVILEDHPFDKSHLPMFVQHGYCSKCKKIEWFRYCSSQPASPIIWFTCKD